MDARITRDPHLYQLRDINTGEVIETDLKPLAAHDRRNVLWARGIKTRMFPIYSDQEYAFHNRSFCS